VNRVDASVGDAFAAILEPLFARLYELERRLEELDAPDWLTLEQAADRYRSTPAALRKRAQRGQLPGAVRDGARWLVDRRMLDAALTVTIRASDNKGSRRVNGRARGTRRDQLPDAY
jgi:hypothetical protein